MINLSQFIISLKIVIFPLGKPIWFSIKLYNSKSKSTIISAGRITQFNSHFNLIWGIHFLHRGLDQVFQINTRKVTSNIDIWCLHIECQKWVMINVIYERNWTNFKYFPKKNFFYILQNCFHISELMLKRKKNYLG